ncbi:MAG TPA: fumarate hydratase [Methanotrichaceae archaeon]|nr:fumarate hydratase [Methanotrichaceae archaeon]
MKRADVVDATVRVLKQAETTLPDWALLLIETASQQETNPVARSHLQFMLENVRIAGAEGLPLCQDTGLLVFRAEIGRDLKLDFDLRDAIAAGVRIATKEIPLRPNVVDPLTRQNTGDNTGTGIPDIILEMVEGNGLKLTAFPKGAGSENMSLVGMLNPADDPFEFILNAVAQRAVNACPPLFLGIGLGGTFDLAARLAKRALLNMPGSSEEELKLLAKINSLGIGPMGLGGDTTALGVKIEKAFCHTASLPVAINFQCWANRSASEELR